MRGMSSTASLRHAALVAVCSGLSTAAAFVSLASAACTETPPGGTTITCEGDQSAGISYFNSPYTNLIVQNLTQPISPTTGIEFQTSVGGLDLKLFASLGTQGIEVAADYRNGIVVSTGITEVSNSADAHASGGDIDVEIVGNVSKTGDASNAIRMETAATAMHDTVGDADAQGGNLTFSMTGAVKTKLAGSAIHAYAGANAYVTEGDATATAGNAHLTTDEITTSDYGAPGILATSGTNAFAVQSGRAFAYAGTVTIDSLGPVTTSGQYSPAVTGASSAYASAIDGATATSADAIIKGTSIRTDGNDSDGLVAASTALADAMSGDAIATSGNAVTVGGGNIETHGMNASAIQSVTDATAHVYGDGNAVATGTTASITAGEVVTRGPLSYGLEAHVTALAQTVGVGTATAHGGTLDIASSQSITVDGDFSNGIHVDKRDQAIVEGSGTATATGGDVTITSAKIFLKGSSSIGINAANAAEATSSTDAYAQGGDVKISAHDITMAGDASFAIYAETRATADTAAIAGDVTVKTTGAITANGISGIGIVVTSASGSTGTAENGDLTVNVASGSVSGGFVAVYFYGGANNTLSNKGTLSANSGLTVYAVADGDETIENEGLIRGSVDLGTGANTFNNRAGGTYEIGDFAALGVGRSLTNFGFISPGGNGALQTSTVYGNFEQRAGGKWLVDADWTAPAPGNADLIVVLGDVKLAGTVVAIPANFPLTTAGATNQFHIMHAEGTISLLGIAAADTATVDYELELIGNDLFLNATIDFLGTPGGLNHNQTEIARYLNAALDGGAPSGFTSVLSALVSLPDKPALAAALDQLSPEIYSYAKIETLFASEQFSSDLMSCRVADGDGYAVIREGQCIWARARARYLNLDATYENLGADSTVGSFSAGGQVAVAPSVRLGFALGYDDISLDSGTSARASGDRVNVGAVAKYERGPLLLAASLAGGWSDLDTSRQIAFGGFSGATSADTSIDYGLARLHAAYLIERASWYAKPLVDATVTRIEFDGVDETGGSGAALLVASGSGTIFSVSPAVEVGTEYRFSALSVVRPFLRGGVTWRDADSIDLTASFAALPASVGAFTIETALDDLLVDVAAGFDLINAAGAVLRIQYDGRFGDETAQNSASFKGSVPF